MSIHPVILNEVIRPMRAEIGEQRMVSLSMVESEWHPVGSSYRVEVRIAALGSPEPTLKTRSLSFEHASIVFRELLPQLKN